MHKAGEQCLSPCGRHSAGGWRRRNDKFRPFLHSLACGAAGPPSHSEWIISCSTWGFSSMAMADLPGVTWAEATGASLPALTQPQWRSLKCLSHLFHSSLTQEWRQRRDTPTQGRVCLAVSSASDMYLDRTQALVSGRALGNPMAPCRQSVMEQHSLQQKLVVASTQH